MTSREPLDAASPPPLRAWAEELRRYGWIYPIIGLVILIVGTDPVDVGAAEVARRLAIFEAISISIGLCITLLYATITNRLVDRGDVRPELRGLLHLVTLVLGVGLGGELALASLPLVGLGIPAAPEVRLSILRIGGAIGLTVMIASITFERLRQRTLEVERHADRVEGDLLRAQLATIQARMHPHFLFNSLNTLADLVETDPPRAVEAIERLASLLRHALERDRLAMVPLSRELELVEDYVALERLRFGDRLRFEQAVDPDTLELPVPPFLLQPMVENAIKHGVAASRRGACVRLSTRREGSRLEVDLVDDGPGEGASGGTQTGEADLRARLALLYGDAASLESGPRPEGGYGVRLSLDPRAAGGDA